MLENMIWFLVCGSGATIATLLWKKYVLDRVRKWFIGVVILSLFMAFGVSKFFDSALAAMLVAFVIMPPVLYLAKLFCDTLLKVSDDYKLAVERINELGKGLILGFWFAFAIGLLNSLI